MEVFQVCLEHSVPNWKSAAQWPSALGKAVSEQVAEYY